MSALQERRVEAQTWAGYRSAHVARSTGTLVVVVDGYEQGLESADDPEACRWFTICDTHDSCVGHDSLRLARWHAVAPEGWCDDCTALVTGHPFVEHDEHCDAACGCEFSDAAVERIRAGQS